MLSNVYIRKAVPVDIPTLVEYNLALAKETERFQLNKEFLQLGVKNSLKRGDCFYFVAEYDKKVIGQTMITHEWRDWRNGIIWWLQSVYIKPDHRKQGVFKKILHYIESLAKDDSHIKALRLYVMNNNHSAKIAYRKLGMHNSNYIIYDNDLLIEL
tara:strand:- start:6408 stop:6875 length:468 start_codon:yes stop_codon:yes gene_type:complete